jgi:hypothetical protein
MGEKRTTPHRHRRLIVDLVGVLALVTWVAAVTAVLTHDPQDPPTPLVHPAHAQPINAFHLAGAWLSANLLNAFGWSLAALLGAWYVAGWALLLERRTGSWSRRLLGWTLLVPTTALLTHQLAVASGPTPWGPGGRLGVLLQQLIASQVPADFRVWVNAALCTVAVLLAFDWCWPFVKRLAVAAWNARRAASPDLALATAQARPMKPTALAGNDPTP